MNVLLIQILRLGDALQMLPVIKGLKECFPQSKIHVLTSVIGKQVFENQTQVEEIFVLNKQKISDLVRGSQGRNILSAAMMLQSALEPMLKIKWDWVINFSFSFSSALLGFILDARHRSGFIVNKNRQYLSKEKWFAHSLASFTNRRYSNFNWVDINNKIIGLPSVPGPPLLESNSKDLRNASAYIKKVGFEGKKIVGMHPGASGGHKRWPIEKFGDLGQALVNKHGYRVFIFGGESEKDLGARLKSHIGSKAENLAGETTLGDLKAFLSLCDVLITNDTGPMHLASSLGTKVIALFFSTHFVETGPYGTGHVAVHPDISCFPCQGTAKCPHKNCLNYILPETIEEIILNGKILEKNNGVDFLGRDKGMVRVYFSGFDPWGILEWVPLDRGPITFQAIERMLLKTSWLQYSGIINGDDNSEGEYISRITDYYGDPSSKTDLADKIQVLNARLLKFKGLLEMANKTSLDIQSELVKSDSDPTVVKHLGYKLTEAEDEISSFGKDSSISFLSELLAVFRENIEQTDILGLSTKTMGVYRDMMAITDGMINRSKKMAKFVSDL